MIRQNKELLNYVMKLHQSEANNAVIEQTFTPKQQIIQHGKQVIYVCIFKSGIAKCFLTEDNGKEFIEEFFGEGEIVGEIEVINEHLSVANIEAISDLVVYKIKKDTFNRLLESDKTFNHLILKALSSKIHYKAIRHSYNQSHPVESNLLRLKKDFPDFISAIPKQDIANYLGITLRSLNRTLNDLKVKGIF
ncbi:MAG: Crp/Fnr family transcriptional regulator [Bacteroidota bacterium]